MAGHEEEDYMRDVDTHDTEGFVAGVPDLDDLEISDHEVTYRRADFSTNFLTSRFEALDQAEFVTQGKASIQFAAVTHNAGDLDDDDDDAIFSPALVLAAPKSIAKSAAPAAASTTTADENAMPTGEVPDARAVGYHCVNPSFESDAAPREIFTVLLAALHKHDITTKTRADWTIEAFALVAAEEVSFRVQLHRLASRTVIRVDLNLLWGNEMLFVSTADKIMSECRSIDKDMQNLPDLSFDFMMDWSDPHAELFPSKATVNEAVLQLLLDEIHSTTSHPETRYEAAKTLKDLCQLPRNRSAVAADYREQFIQGLDAMLQDQDEDIVRFAIFAIQTFASDESLRATLEFPELSDKLRTISSSSTKSSTKKLADELLHAIVSPVS